MTEQVNLIPARLKSAVVGGHVAGAADIIDDVKGKTQNQINSEVDTKFGQHDNKFDEEDAKINALETGNFVTLEATDADTTIADVFTRLSITPATNVVYRIANWKHNDATTKYNVAYYSEYAANGNTTADLVPISVENKGIDDVPTVGNDNLVKSSGVAVSNLKNVQINSSTELYDRSSVILHTDLTSYSGAETPSSTYNCSPFIPMDNNTKMWVTCYNNNVFVYDSSKNFIGRISVPAGKALKEVSSSYTNAAYIRIVFNNAMINTARVGLTERENLVKDYFDYDSEFTKNSNALVTSGVLFEKIIGSTALIGGVNTYSMIAGRKYFIKNTGTAQVNVYYKVSQSSEEILFISNLNPQEHIFFNAQVDSSFIAISNETGAEVTIWNPDAIDGQLLNIQDEVKKIEVKESSQDLNGGSNSYNTVVGERYIFENTGTETVSIYYKVDAQSTDVEIYQNLPVGESFEYSPIVNASIIYISNSAGAKITVTRIYEGSIIKRINTLEKEQNNTPTLIRVATFNTGDYSGKNLVIGTEAAKLAYRKLIGELGANIIGTQEDEANYDGGNIKDAFWLMFKNYNRKGGSEYNYKAFASDYNITNIKQISYIGQYYDHYYFLVGELIIKDKTILVISFHFDWSDNDRRHEQIRQVIAYAANYEHVIMMGDTNCENYINRVVQEPKNLCDVEWPIFSEAGYDMANGAYFGWFDTCGYDEETQYPLDNIFVKGDIVIRNAGTIVKDWTNDHCVLYTDILIV